MFSEAEYQILYLSLDIFIAELKLSMQGIRILFMQQKQNSNVLK